MKNSADLKREFQRETGLQPPDQWWIDCFDFSEFRVWGVEGHDPHETCGVDSESLENMVDELPRFFEYMQWLESKLAEQ